MTDPLAPIALNGATLAAFTVNNPGETYARVTVTNESGSFVVRRDSVHLMTHADSVVAIAHAMDLAGWLDPITARYHDTGAK